MVIFVYILCFSIYETLLHLCFTLRVALYIKFVHCALLVCHYNGCYNWYSANDYIYLCMLSDCQLAHAAVQRYNSLRLLRQAVRLGGAATPAQQGCCNYLQYNS